MSQFFQYAAAVAVTNPDGTLMTPAIYTIQIPTPDGQSLSGDDAVLALAKNIWMVVGDRIVAAEVVQRRDHTTNSRKMRPLQTEAWLGAGDAPVILTPNLYDPRHADYLELQKCISPEQERTAWQVRSFDYLFGELVAHSACSPLLQFAKFICQGMQGYLLRQDGRLIPHLHVYDHMTVTGGYMSHSSVSDSSVSGLQDGRSRYSIHYDGSLGVNPLDTVGPPPLYEPEEDFSSDSEEELYTDPEPRAEKKPNPRVRSAGNRMKREALGASSTKIPSRRGRLPSRGTKKVITRIIARKNLLPKRGPRLPPPKKTVAAKPSSRPTTASPKKLPVVAPSPKKPASSVAPLSLPASAPPPSQTSPVRFTRSATRQGIMSLPPITPPLPERRIVAPRATQHVSPGADGAPQNAVSSMGLPAHSPREYEPIAGPSRIPMEDVGKDETGPYSLRPRGPRRSLAGC